MYADEYEEAAYGTLSDERAIELAQRSDLACILASRDDMPSLAGRVHDTLINHDDWYVPYTMAHHEQLPHHLAVRLARHEHPQVAHAIAARSQLHPETAAALLEHADAGVRIKALRHTDTPSHLIHAHAAEGSLVAQEKVRNTPELAMAAAGLTLGARMASQEPAVRKMSIPVRDGRSAQRSGPAMR